MTMPVVVLDPSQYFFPLAKAGQLYGPYKCGQVGQFASRVLRKLGLMSQITRLFGDWYKVLEQGGKIVVLDAAFDPKMLELLAPYKHNVIVFMWNPVQMDYYACIDLMKCRDVFDFYSHDRSDCEKYGFKFNSTFYTADPNFVPQADELDIVYLGRAKGRIADFVTIYNQLQGLRQNYHIFDDKRAGEQVAPGLTLQGEFIDYPTYLKRVYASKAVLEVMQKGQDSLTLRAMESVFYHKKLITNYQNIVNEDFYRQSNILVYESPQDLSRQRVEAFLLTPYEPLDPALIKQYEFENWLRRFE